MHLVLHVSRSDLQIIKIDKINKIKHNNKEKIYNV